MSHYQSFPYYALVTVRHKHSKRPTRRSRLKLELIMMDGQELQKIADDYAIDLPCANLEHHFGADWHLYKVRGKIFMLMTTLPGHPIAILKADPDDATALREQYAEITPGYHMDHMHWITVAGGGTIGEKMLKRLVLDSYRLVVATLPRPDQPVDPYTYEHHA
ncbi:MmcQ/YjbR family DNA-binding protein [Streptomyces sp. NPDC101209]|uniref:MmcQ/YjbR family DNA-binding protein n=1 Tax=Streptomyces sp. NPDC101209 TaxID=3366129 RepID=UPI003819F45A